MHLVTPSRPFETMRAQLEDAADLPPVLSDADVVARGDRDPSARRGVRAFYLPGDEPFWLNEDLQP